MTFSLAKSSADDGPRGGGPRILLVSPDLMSTSRLAGLAGEAGCRLETLRGLDGPLPVGPWDLLLLDLQSLHGDPAVLVTRCLALLEPRRTDADRPARVVAFGPHVAKDRLDQAKAAGADAAVSRGELLGAFSTLVRRWCGTVD